MPTADQWKSAHAAKITELTDAFARGHKQMDKLPAGTPWLWFVRIKAVGTSPTGEQITRPVVPTLPQSFPLKHNVPSQKEWDNYLQTKSNELTDIFRWAYDNLNTRMEKSKWNFDVILTPLFVNRETNEKGDPFKNAPEPERKPEPEYVRSNTTPCNTLFKEQGISTSSTCRKEFNKWALKNHPDKVGSDPVRLELFKRMSHCRDEVCPAFVPKSAGKRKTRRHHNVKRRHTVRRRR